ncbi:PaaI family thioesterase [Endozoicomonas atrinae]
MSLVKADRNGIELEMPYDSRLIGNPETGVIHSGAITTLMDSCCGLAVFTRMEQLEACPTLDLRIDHMTTAQPDKPVRAFAEAYHITRSMVFTRGVAYQESRDQPIAHAVGTFMRIGQNSMKSMQERFQ